MGELLVFLGACFVICYQYGKIGYLREIVNQQYIKIARLEDKLRGG